MTRFQRLDGAAKGSIYGAQALGVFGGPFSDTQLRNALAPGTEGNVTLHIPKGREMPFSDAAQLYQASGIPLIILAGKEYGSGSSCDWAAKSPNFLGVQAVIAESFDGVHRSSLNRLGIYPLKFIGGQSVESLGLTGREVFEIDIPDVLAPGMMTTVTYIDPSDVGSTFTVRLRIDTPDELQGFNRGGDSP